MSRALFTAMVFPGLFAAAFAGAAASGPPSPAVATEDPITHQGIDVSHHQGEVDWAKVGTAGVVFAFAKATEGGSFVDPMFAANWAGMRAAGLVRGAYHFFDPDIDAAVQAESFIATVKLEPGDLPPVLDIEVSQGVGREGIDADIRLWLDKVAAAYGVRPILYSDPSFIDAYLANGFSDHPLWLAAYEKEPPPAPGDWKSWTLWQHTQGGSVAGVSGPVDQSLFQGTAAGWVGLLVAP